MATIPATLRPRLSRRAVAALLVAALGVPLVVGAGWLALSGDDLLGEMELAAVGDVTVLRGGESIAVDGTLDLEPGDVVMTQARSTAQFNLEGDRGIELAPESRALILGPSGISVEFGSAFADAGDQMKAVIGEVTVSNGSHDAVFRLDRTSSVRAGVYSGQVQLSVPGEETLRIPRLYEASVPLAAPDVPTQPSPYGLVNADEWDARELHKVINLDEQLRATAGGLADQFGKARPPLSYFRGVAGTKVDFMKSYIHRRPANLIVALTVAKGSSSSRSLASGFREAMGLFDQGARWGVAAAIMKAKPRRLLAGLDALIERSGVGGGNGQAASAFAAATGADGASGGPGDGGTTFDGSGDDPGDPGDPTDPPKDPDPQPTETPTDDPTDPPEECSNDIECAINDIEPPVDNPLEQELGKKTEGGGDSVLPSL